MSVFISCGGNENESLYAKDPDVLVLRFSLKSKIPAARADYEEEGNPQENYINLKDEDFRIAIYGEDGKFIIELTQPEVAYGNNDQYHLEYFVKKEILATTDNIQIVALANWGSFRSDAPYNYPDFSDPSSSDISTIEELWKFDKTFALPDPNSSWRPDIENKNLIPMTGYKKMNINDNVSMENGYPTLHIVVPMVRALSKVSFQVSDRLYAQGFDINECNVINYFTKGRLIPNLLDDRNKIDVNGEMELNHPSCPVQERNSSALSFINMGEEGGKSVLVAYLPEMDNSDLRFENEGRPKFNLSISYEDSNYVRDKIIEFSTYEDDGEFTEESRLLNLLRNHYYSYTIVEITETKTLILKYTVCEWKNKETEIEFN